MLNILLTIVLGSIPLPEYYRLHMEKAFMRAAVSFEDTMHDFDVLHYDIHVRLLMQRREIDAHNRVTFVSKIDGLDSIFLHLDGLTIDSITGAASYYREDTVIHIQLPYALNRGDTGEVTVYYHGRPRNFGAVRGGGLIFTRDGHEVSAYNEPYGGKRWLPMYDLPSDKVLVDQYITVPMGFTVVANGILVDSTLNSDSTLTFHWRENYPIANYLIVFAASDRFIITRDSVNINGTWLPIINYLNPADTLRARGLFDRVPEMMEFFSNLFGPYPFMGEKYAHVDVRISAAMENQTNTFLDMRNVNPRWEYYVISHELAHQWWGDWVTLGVWDDIWLNEGFASYCEALWAEHNDGFSGLREYIDYFHINYIHEEPYEFSPVCNQGTEWAVITVYFKGASVLHMLRYLVGDSTFFEILRTYGTNYGYGNAVTSEFIDVSNQVSGMDLNWFFDEWLYYPGHPIYSCTYYYVPAGNDSFMVTFQIDQLQDHSRGVPTYKMPIQLKVITDRDTSDITVWDSLDHQEFNFVVYGVPQEIIFDPDNWILDEHTVVNVFEEDGEKEISFNTVSRGYIVFSTPIRKPIVARIYDITGRLVKRVSLDPGTKRLDVRSLKTGFYYLDTGNSMSKFFKF